MIGELIVTFCERGESGSHKAVELWAFPDGTTNLVIAMDSPTAGHEQSFPCTISQLQGVVDGKSLLLRADSSSVSLQRETERVCASFSGFGNDWRQCIDAELFQTALDHSITLSPITMI